MPEAETRLPIGANSGFKLSDSQQTEANEIVKNGRTIRGGDLASCCSTFVIDCQLYRNCTAFSISEHSRWISLLNELGDLRLVFGLRPYNNFREADCVELQSFN